VWKGTVGPITNKRGVLNCLRELASEYQFLFYGLFTVSVGLIKGLEVKARFLLN